MTDDSGGGNGGVCVEWKGKQLIDDSFLSTGTLEKSVNFNWT